MRCPQRDQLLTIMTGGIGLEPELRDVDADPELYRLYDWRVPVVLFDGRVVAEGRIDQEVLHKALPAV